MLDIRCPSCGAVVGRVHALKDGGFSWAIVDSVAMRRYRKAAGTTDVIEDGIVDPMVPSVYTDDLRLLRTAVLACVEHGPMALTADRAETAIRRSVRKVAAVPVVQRSAP